MTTWTAELLNASGSSQGLLPFQDVTAGSTRSDGFRATLSGVDMDPYMLLGVSVRLRAGSEVVGTLVPTGAPETRTSARTSYQVELSDRRSNLAGDRPLDVYSLAAGAGLVTALFAVIRGTGDLYPVAVPDGGKVMPTGYTRSGVDWATIADELLAAMGYDRLRTDEWGSWTADPLDAWLTADPVAALGPDAIQVSPKSSGDQNLLAVPNRMVATRKTDGTAPADRAVVTDEDPGSPFSYPARGRWITADPITDVDAADFAALQAVLQRKFDTQRLTSVHTLQVAPSALRAGQVVDVRGVDGIAARTAVVESVSRPMLGPMTVEVRGIR